MRRARVKQTDPDREAQAMREHQSREEKKTRFIQEDEQKRQQLYGLWKVAGFPFVPKRTYQPNVLWEVYGVPEGLSLLRYHLRPSIRFGSEVDHRLVMAQESAALHYIKEAPNSCRSQHDLTPGQVYEVLEGLWATESYCKTRDDLIEILMSFTQSGVPAVGTTDEQHL